MKHLQIEDMERLSREVGELAENSEEWAERVGLDPGLLNAIGNVATNMAHEKTVAMARQEIEESGHDIEDILSGEEDGYAMRMDIGDIIKAACISMFALGFETHKQFGSADRDMSQ